MIDRCQSCIPGRFPGLWHRHTGRDGVHWHTVACPPLRRSSTRGCIIFPPECLREFVLFPGYASRGSSCVSLLCRLLLSAGCNVPWSCRACLSIVQPTARPTECSVWDRRHDPIGPSPCHDSRDCSMLFGAYKNHRKRPLIVFSPLADCRSHGHGNSTRIVVCPKSIILGSSWQVQCLILPERLVRTQSFFRFPIAWQNKHFQRWVALMLKSRHDGPSGTAQSPIAAGISARAQRRTLPSLGESDAWSGPRPHHPRAPRCPSLQLWCARLAPTRLGNVTEGGFLR